MDDRFKWLQKRECEEDGFATKAVFIFPRSGSELNGGY
jgi:hypothetical protein